MKRIASIDGLRAIAILMVIAFHYVNNQLVNTSSAAGRFFYHATSFGWVGVDLFFVLSGFLIGSILLQNRQSPKLLKTFYIRRFVRIVPNYYLLLVIFLIISALPYFKNDYFLTGNNVIPTWSYFTMLHNFYMAGLENLGNDSMSVTWSIGIEEQFYLLFPFIILLIREKWLHYFLVFIILMAIYCRSLYTHWIPAYVLLSCRMDAIAFGILVAWIHTRYSIVDFVRREQSRLLVAMALVVLVSGILFYLYRDLGVIRNSLFALVFAGIILMALGKPESLLSKFLSLPLLRWIGKISYSLYLFHYLILGLFKNIAARFVPEQGAAFSIGVCLSALVFSFLFSWIVYEYLEKRAVAWGKKYSYA